MSVSAAILAFASAVRAVCTEVMSVALAAASAATAVAIASVTPKASSASAMVGAMITGAIASETRVFEGWSQTVFPSESFTTNLYVPSP